MKHVLYVGKETFMYPFLFLDEKWKEKYITAALWINPHESGFTECDFNSSTFYEFRRRGIKEYTLDNAVKEFDRFADSSLDYDSIRYLEEKYSHFKNFNQQIISDQMMSVCYHTRDFNCPPTYEQQLLWLKCLYQRIEEILDDYCPDVVFDCDIAELPRTVLNEVAHKREIPYITINYPRYGLYKIPSYTLDIGIEKYFINEYQKCLNRNNDEETEYIRDYRERNTIKNKMFMVSGNPTYCYKIEPILDTLKSIYGRWIYFNKEDKSKQNRSLKKQNPVIFVNSKKHMRFWIKDRLFRRYLYKTKKVFENPIEGEPYVYMPLHLVPESTTYCMAPFWINELSLIEAVSKSLPAGWRLYVKEHQAMLGERSMDFYRHVKRIPNVRLVRFNFYDDPKPWIEKAKAVITITGTSAYEAALLGKPAYVFGDASFTVIKGITRVRAVEDLPNILQTIREVEDVDNAKECAAYIRAVKQVGKSVDLGNIMNKAYNNLTKGTDLDESFWKEIENLREFFEDAYEHAKERAQ